MIKHRIEKAIRETLVIENKQSLDIAVNKILDIFYEKKKCYNCDEMVIMVSTGEICPKCYC